MTSTKLSNYVEPTEKITAEDGLFFAFAVQNFLPNMAHLVIDDTYVKLEAFNLPFNFDNVNDSTFGKLEDLETHICTNEEI